MIEPNTLDDWLTEKWIDEMYDHDATLADNMRAFRKWWLEMEDDD